jgi:hypothetical protein
MSSFTITAAGQTVALDAAGSGQAAFTVTNTTGATIRGRAIPTPQPGAEGGQAPAKEWFTIQGEALRGFAPGTAEQVVVAVKVPPGTPPGKYAVRLDVVAEANPDEDFTQGPSVSFDVAATAPKKPFPVWIPIVILLVLIAGGLTTFLLTRGDDGKKPPTTPTPLPTHEAPAQPTILAPDEGTTFPAVPAGLTVRWQASPGADRYRVVVQKCTSNCETDGVEFRNKVVSGTDFDVNFTERSPGRVRVVPLRGDVEGEPSAWRNFRFEELVDTTPTHVCIPCLVELLEARPKLEVPVPLLQDRDIARAMEEKGLNPDDFRPGG